METEGMFHFRSEEWVLSRHPRGMSGRYRGMIDSAGDNLRFFFAVGFKPL